MAEKESEAQRRMKVAQEKLGGAIIEAIERSRKNPIAKSLAFRIYYLHGSIVEFNNALQIVLSSINPVKTVVPTVTLSGINVLIKTYNDIISDIHLNFKKRDATVNSFSDFEELETPNYNDITKIVYRMAIALNQVMSYLVRWM